MCIQCHQGFSDEDTYNQLNVEPEELKFGRWNSTSLSHLCITASGFNGDKCRELGIKILEDYYKWNKDNKHLLITTGDDRFYMSEQISGTIILGGVSILNFDKHNHRVVSLNKLRANIDYIKNNKLDSKDEEKLKEYMKNIQFGRDKLDEVKYLFKCATPLDYALLTLSFFAGYYFYYLVF